MLKSDVFFAEILVAYSRLLVTVDRSVCSLCFWNICWKAIFTASLPLPTCTWPMCIWPFCFLGSSPDRGQSPKEWGDFWFVHLFGPSSHVSQAWLAGWMGFRHGWLGEWTDRKSPHSPGLFNHVHATSYVTMSVRQLVCWSVRPNSLRSASFFFGVLSWKEVRFELLPCPPAYNWCYRVYGLVPLSRPLPCFPPWKPIKIPFWNKRQAGQGNCWPFEPLGHLFVCTWLSVR